MFSEKCKLTLASKFTTIYHSLKCLVNEKMQFKAALKRYLNTNFFYSVDEFLMFKNES
jgi:hypothetical protein